ncbi:hypothetical protein DFA_01125 [Cavenderia fasciculata]|uniref:Uncharacterized protein n=1 Tax=Cavenderia fasciculata TaxID=261658 RepID=F4PQY2_CACFS|nr:uncharacterized protein DFA_01125 [Cavenderia fasciculata]EGG21247.1 hypothetical protein DFA_01125 [Cavenderia fasciculata]|eukprot:XP_004359097.1 hypothetical protein DFA_01125 [Cavenderia fasciculata]
MTKRAAYHGGNWYASDSNKLGQQLSGWLGETKSIKKNTKALIVPHAGYDYSGRAASRGYINLSDTTFKRIFVLGPSHHVYTKSCGLSKHTHLETPVGDLKVDVEITNKLNLTGQFTWMTKEIDEEEHSLEMHFPYIAQVTKGRDITIVPVLVGNVPKENLKTYADIFAPYLDDPDNFFIISSDFCHWGSRFDYSPHDPSCGAIHQFIEKMDKNGMKAIESGDPSVFADYLKETKNTICGRNPISLFLWIIHSSKLKFEIQSLYYEQSSKCNSMRDSSVSYGVISFNQL